jgi:membrane protein YdbS with pleckstrin-like domain
MQWYRLVMDPRVNPLASLPAAQRFQIMALLSVMWTLVFCAAIGSWLFFGHLVAAHMFVLVGVLVTAWAFKQSSRTTSYRDHPLEDGTARYDDVWGG